MDNLTDKIRLWSQTGYQYIERQSQYDPNQWVWAVGPGSSQAHALEAEEVSIDIKPVIWPTWTTAQIADSSEPTNLDELPAALVSEVVERIKLRDISAAEARKQADQTSANKKLAVTAVAEMVMAESGQKLMRRACPANYSKHPPQKHRSNRIEMPRRCKPVAGVCNSLAVPQRAPRWQATITSRKPMGLSWGPDNRSLSARRSASTRIGIGCA